MKFKLPQLPAWIRATGRPEGQGEKTPTPDGEPKILAFAAPVDLQAAKADGKRPTFSIQAYDGSPMVVAGFYYPVIAELSGMKAARAKLPILLDHDRTQIVGQSSKIEISDAGVKIDGTVTGDDEIANRVVAHAKNGFEWQASIGATVNRREFLEAGESTTVNGRTVTGPLIIARESTLYETSFVAIGANETATATVAAAHSETPEIGAESMTFEDWLKAGGWTPEKLSDAQKKTLRAAFDAEQKRGTPPVQEKGNDGVNAGEDVEIRAAYRQQVADEEKRIAEIRRIVKASGVDYGIDREGNRVENLVAHAIQKGLSADQVELLAERAARKTAPPAGHVKGGDTVDAKVIEASLALAGGVEEEIVAKGIPSSDRERVMNCAVSAENRGFGLHRLMATICILAGRPYHGDHKSDEFIRATYEAEKILATSGFTTVSLSGILSNVANKKLLSAFMSVQTVVDAIAASESASDFKAFKSYRLGMSGDLELVSATGKLSHAELIESEFENRVRTRGKMVTLTREHQINDDLGAFLAIPRMLGRKAAISREKVTLETYLNALATFYTAGKGNYISGTNSVLSIAGLDLAVKAFRERKGPDNELVLAAPKKLFVPPALESTAKSLHRETRVNETTASGKKSPADNPYVGMFEPVVSSYFGAAGAPGSATGSDSHWLLLADPADIPTVTVAYLRGQRTPTIERGTVDFDTLGTSYRCVYDFGVAMTDDCGGVMSKGAQ